MGGMVANVERRSYKQQVASSIPGLAQRCDDSGQSHLHQCASVAKQYNLMLT